MTKEEIEVPSDDKARPVVPVHECWSDGEGNIIVSVLRDGGIEATVNSELTHSVFPLKTAGLGRVRVLVDEDLADKALEIIENHRQAAPDDFQGEPSEDEGE